MEHKLISGGEQYLPFARSRIKALKAAGLKYASQQFEIDGATIKVRVSGDHEYITLDGKPGKVWILVYAFKQDPVEKFEVRSKLFCLNSTLGAKHAKLVHSGRGEYFAPDGSGPTFTGQFEWALDGSAPPTVITDFVPYGKTALVWARYQYRNVDVRDPPYGTLSYEVFSTTKTWWGVELTQSFEQPLVERTWFNAAGSPEAYTTINEGSIVVDAPAMLAPGQICYSVQSRDYPIVDPGPSGGYPLPTYAKVVSQLDANGHESTLPVQDPDGAKRKLFTNLNFPERSSSQPAYTRREFGADCQGHKFLFDQARAVWYDRRATIASRKSAAQDVNNQLTGDIYLHGTAPGVFDAIRLASAAGKSETLIGTIRMIDIPDVANDPFFVAALAANYVGLKFKASPAELFTPGVSWDR